MYAYYWGRVYAQEHVGKLRFLRRPLCVTCCGAGPLPRVLSASYQSLRDADYQGNPRLPQGYIFAQISQIMVYKSRVAVHSQVGRRIYTVHAQLAAAMVLHGEAEYESPGIIVLTQTVRVTAEMTRPAIGKFRVPHADSSCGGGGLGNTAVPPRQSLHYRSDAEQTPSLLRDGRTCGYRRNVA
jgi:hypothetical protein